MKRRLLLAAGAALAALSTVPALAQQPGEVCFNQGFYDAALTQQWQRSLAASSAEAIGQIAGVWYNELPNAQLGMVVHQYQSFEPNGLFQYQNRTCGGGGPLGCRDDYGHGRYAAIPQADGSIFIAVNFSDTQRTNACIGSYWRVEGGTALTDGGYRWQRVK